MFLVTLANSDDIQVPTPFMLKPYDCRIRIQRGVPPNSYSFRCNRCPFNSKRVNIVNAHLNEHRNNLPPIDIQINNQDNQKKRKIILTSYERLKYNEKLLCPFCLCAFSTSRINALLIHKKYCKQKPKCDCDLCKSEDIQKFKKISVNSWSKKI